MSDQKIMLVTFIGVAVFICCLVAFLSVILLSFRRKQAEYRRESLLSRLEVQEHTLKQISLEIHDNVGHNLTLAKLKIKSISQKMGAPLLLHELAEINQLVVKSLADLRDLSKSLSIDIIHNEGLISAIDKQMNLLRGTPGLEIDFQVSGTYDYLTEENEVILFRILQEGITNVVRHSKATIVSVFLHSSDEIVSLTIVDNGVGFSISEIDNGGTAKRHIGGLNNIKARAALLKANFELKSMPGQGTLLKVEVPFSKIKKARNGGADY